MSNLLYMDESNGNGVYATNKPNNATATAAAVLAAAATTTTTAAGGGVGVGGTITTTITATNNINNIMNVTTTATNVTATLPTSVSTEDLSQSLSEYTDADESISAPTEFLAEFLSAVMLKDYKKALKYCKLILQYEPNNATAKEFYPLILDKLRGAASSDSDENYNKSSSPELVLELQCSDPSAGESDEAQEGGLDEQNLALDYTADDYDGVAEEPFCVEPHSHGSNASSNCSDGISLSESVESENDEVDDGVDEDVEEDDDDDVEDEDDDDEDDEDEVDGDEEEDVMSSSGDDLPIDEQQDLARVACVADQNDGNASNSSRNSSSGGGGRSRSDNTTHSYSSLLLEEEDDIVPVNLHFSRDTTTDVDLDISNGNKIPSASCSDSESPTEPLTQRLAAILRSKCGVSSNKD